MSNAENNRKLAEWLGWRWDKYELHWHIPSCTADIGYECGNGPHVDSPPDFYASEEANAMLLDAMPEPDLCVESSKGEPK